MTGGRLAASFGLGPTAILLVARVIALGTGLVAVFASARLYGADGRGVIAAFAVLQFLAATGLALGSGSGAFLAAHRSSHAPVLVGSGVVTLAAGLGVLASVLAAAAWIAGLWTVAVPGTTAAVAIALGVAVAGQYLVLGGSQIAMGAGSTGRTAVGWILGPLVMLMSVGIAAILALGVADFLIVQSAAWLLAGLGFVVIAGHGAMPSLTAARDLLQLGSGAAVGDLTNALSYRLDVLLVVWLAGSAAAGVYSLATQLMEPLWLLATSAAGGLLIGFRNQDAATRAASTARAGVRVALLTAAGVGGVLLLLPIVSSLAGPDFEGTFAIGVALAPGIVLLAIAKVFAAYQTALGRLWLGSVIATIAVAIAIVGGLILIPGVQGLGAAIAATISYGVACILWLVAFRGYRSADAEINRQASDRGLVKP
ncbi:MAG: polysaccharide biosynthesis C-terminal domain-containing protein [Chloroflexi bacterium]|nr:polysaccharide biosynthesis C-terminal domain-containing protein [Chloroflexota bacterium]